MGGASGGGFGAAGAGRGAGFEATSTAHRGDSMHRFEEKGKQKIWLKMKGDSLRPHSSEEGLLRGIIFGSGSGQAISKLAKSSLSLVRPPTALFFFQGLSASALALGNGHRATSRLIDRAIARARATAAQNNSRVEAGAGASGKQPSWLTAAAGEETGKGPVERGMGEGTCKGTGVASGWCGGPGASSGGFEVESPEGAWDGDLDYMYEWPGD